MLRLPEQSTRPEFFSDISLQNKCVPYDIYMQYVLDSIN